MKNGIRIAIALIAGILAGGLIIATIEMLAHSIAEGTGVFIAATVGLGVGAAIGGTASSIIGKNRNLVWLIGLALGGLSMVNVLSFEHPAWFVPVAFVLLASGCLAAFTFSKKWSEQP